MARLMLCVLILQLNESESLKKFPSKSCTLRYGIAKMQEDALNLFNAALREYVGVYHVNTKDSKHQEWAITGLSVSASKIVDIPSVSHSDLVSQASCSYFCTPIIIENYILLIACFPLA